jgi:crotonobetainyl-CoA:carnitine CoA-transferase CaiB-like acyl-CoA transferase
MALLHQKRTGRGQFIEAAMVNLNAFANSEDFNTYAGKQPMPLPDKGEHGLDALYRLYRAAGNGWVFLAARSQAEWRRFTDALAPELAADERFASRSSRQQHDAELADAIGRLLAAKTGSEWEAICVPLGIGCVAFFEGTIGSFSCTDPVIRAAGLVAEVDDPRFGRYLRHGAPVTLSETLARLAGGPAVGEHTTAILAELGYTDAEISALADGRVIGFPPGAEQPAESGAEARQLDGQIRT